MKRSKSLIILVVLFLAIGFAAVSTTLILNGTINVGTNVSDFDVYFSNAIIDGTEDLSLISQDKKTINFETKDLIKVGDKSMLEYEVTNASTQYDANVSVTCTPNETDLYKVINTIDKEIIEARSTGNGTVTVELKKNVLESQKINFTCTISATAVERTEAALEPWICAVTQGNGTNVGDKITCGSESFYVIKNDGTNIRMISEYNLMIGNVATYNAGKWTTTPISNPTGLQSSEAIGAQYLNGSWNNIHTRIATIEFSKVGSSYEGSIVEDYVNEYKMFLENKGIVVTEATLITKIELNAFGVRDNMPNNIPGLDWLYNTSYWTRSASSGNYMWRIGAGGHFYGDTYASIFDNYYYGVRPVILIPVDQI